MKPTGDDPNAAMRIERIQVSRLSVPLIRPYRLSFGDLVAFDTLLVELTDADGRSSFGEATVLTGYTDETIDSAWTVSRQLADDCAGDTGATLRAAADAIGASSPFAATAFLTALEMLSDHHALISAEEVRVPLLALLNADNAESTRDEFERLLADGYRTIKVKVGLCGSDDRARIASIQDVVAGRARIRIDANQAFTGAEAARLLADLDPQDIELFEQPCAATDWAAHASAARASRVPLMLDESIYDLADIERAAAEQLASYVKVKLSKFTSLDRLTEALQRIKALQMQGVLGNGVACDPGCWMEACVAARHIDNAGEMNGYLKVRTPLLTNPPRLERGDMVIEAGYRPVLDRRSIEHQRIALHTTRSPR